MLANAAAPIILTVIPLPSMLIWDSGVWFVLRSKGEMKETVPNWLETSLSSLERREGLEISGGQDWR
jgi:hypothetical protein